LVFRRRRKALVMLAVRRRAEVGDMGGLRSSSSGCGRGERKGKRNLDDVVRRTTCGVGALLPVAAVGGAS
jgi:hypothetical protein